MSRRATVVLTITVAAALSANGTTATHASQLPIEAAFRQRSVAPGEIAVLDVWTSVRDLEIDVARVGPGGSREPLGGKPVTTLETGAARSISLEIGNWPTGLYAASLRDAARHGWAVIVVRPRNLGVHRVAVVLPTNTWHAYNRRDVDRDGTGDTWYESTAIDRVDLWRPFLDSGVPHPASTRTTEPFSTGSPGADVTPTSWRTTISSASRPATASLLCTTSSSSPGTRNT